MVREVSVKVRILRKRLGFMLDGAKYYYPHLIHYGYTRDDVWVDIRCDTASRVKGERPFKIYDGVMTLVYNHQIEPLLPGDLLVMPHDGGDFPDILICTANKIHPDNPPVLIVDTGVSVGDFVSSRNHMVEYYLTLDDTKRITVHDAKVTYHQ